MEEIQDSLVDKDEEIKLLRQEVAKLKSKISSQEAAAHGMKMLRHEQSKLIAQHKETIEDLKRQIKKLS